MNTTRNVSGWMSGRLATTAAALVALAGLGTSALAEPIRDGSGSHRTALNQMELKPFDASVWTKLSDWQGGAIAEGLVKEKVVLVLAYNDFAPAAKRAFALAQRLAEKHGGEGLVVVAAHGTRGWEDAAKPTSAGGALHVAHDATGEFRKALKAESDPDFYLIDRSGQMRYAGISTDSVEESVKQLLAEDATKAAGTLASMKSEQAKRDAQERAVRAARPNVDLARFPELPFTRPDESAYTSAKWPKLPRDTAKNDEIAYLEPRDVALPEDDWFPSRPNFAGKLVVLNFWHPKLGVNAERTANLDRFARQNQRDVIVVMVITDVDGFTVGGKPVKLLKDDKDPEKLREKVTEFAKHWNFEHYTLVDGGGRGTYNAVFRDQTDEVLPIAILSSDGKARWWGHKPAVTWESALDQMLLVDPGVLARRKAEDEWLRKQKGAGATPPAGT